MENLESEIIKDIQKGLIDKLDNLIIEGLKLKGFEFDNRIELMQFISDRVTCHDRQYLQEKTYLIDNIPFFFHKYGCDFRDTIKDNNTFTAYFGEYKFL